MSGEASKTHRLRPEDLTWREAEGAIVVLDQRTWKYLQLNGSGAVLWSAVANGATDEELIGRLQEEYGIDEHLARTDVEKFLAMLAERELLAA